jgi:hypothetical protein
VRTQPCPVRSGMALVAPGFPGHEAARRAGLALPTEAQWEYGARGGTLSTWWVHGLLEPAQALNIADRDYAQLGNDHIVRESWSDGFQRAAPMGPFPPNCFGLHEVIGNVWEWCADWTGPYAAGHRAGDGELLVNPHSVPQDRMYRGGSWDHPMLGARSGLRHGTPRPTDSSTWAYVWRVRSTPEGARGHRPWRVRNFVFGKELRVETPCRRHGHAKRRLITPGEMARSWHDGSRLPACVRARVLHPHQDPQHVTTHAYARVHRRYAPWLRWILAVIAGTVERHTDGAVRAPGVDR